MYPRISVFSFSGVRSRIFEGDNSIGPEEMVQNPYDVYDFALLRCTSAFTNLTLRRVNIDTGDNVDTLVTGLKDGNGNDYDYSVYHQRTIWHTNGRIYTFHAVTAIFGPELMRIVSIDPDTAQVTHEYVIANKFGQGSFVILGNYVYVWQNATKPNGYAAAIVKLTLDLEYVCTAPCKGGIKTQEGHYVEMGRHIVSDGIDTMFNYAYVGPGSMVTKWTV
jgi:hypothetical protein